MKKLLIILLFIPLIFACSNDDNDPYACANLDGTISSSVARQRAINYELEDYNFLVSKYGEPISEGYFKDSYDGIYDEEYYYYAFLFKDGNNKICYSVDSECATNTFSAGCSDINTIDDCDECVSSFDTRIN